MDDLGRARKLGAMLRCARVEDDFEYRFMFDLTANTFLQKLVPKGLMDRKLPISSAGYMQTLVVVDFFTRVVAGDTRLLDNLLLIAEALAKARPPHRLSTGVVVVELGLCAKETPIMPESVAARFQEGPRCTCEPDSVDPYYEAMGGMLLSQMALPEASEKVESKVAYRAAVFTGAVVDWLGGKGEPAKQALLQGRFLDAALEAVSILSSTVGPGDLERMLVGARS